MISNVITHRPNIGYTTRKVVVAYEQRSEHLFWVTMETPQPLHPESKVLVDLLAKVRAKPYSEQTVEEIRAANIKLSDAMAGKIQYNGFRKELFMPQPDFTGTSVIIIELLC